ncbi:MAG: 2-oxoglutarate dehydrogenase complex dihydrolipoyllysine-residue succinyltransferase [Gammaproteobacteria bacterium]|nr:2-oxoglutarate dehydrogenase complex dihydrolipoyllysine-residue succinyltransferase [Gammaproteobacteria bacterium]
MLVEVKVPVLSESIADASLIEWRKKVGDHVSRDENLIELETDKVVLEIPAPQEGVLKEIRKISGESVLSSEVIAVIDTEGVAERPMAEVVSLSSSVDREITAKLLSERVSSNAESNNDVAYQELSPAAKKLVSDNNIDITLLQGTGKGGRVTKEDVLRYLESRSSVGANVNIVSQNFAHQQKAQQSAPKHSTPQQRSQLDSQPALQASPQSITPSISQSILPGDARSDKRVPMTRLRARIAERLKQAQNTAAILTTFNEVNMQPVMELRRRYQEQFTKKYGVKLGFMSFFIKASVEALKKYPVINASIDVNDIIYHNYIDVGIAVSSSRGLVVPILRNVENLSFAEMESNIIHYGKAAKDGSLSMEDLMGGTFTITNGGVFGSLLSTPILNPPQSAILGMHSIQERPVAENGEVVIRPIMNLALSYDHRIIDGHEAVLFLVAIKQALEDPTRMLLQI